MCLSEISTEEILLELKRRNKMTNSKTNNIILSNMSEKNIGVILTFGPPNNMLKCRECCELKNSNQYSFYQARVDSNGYLMRSNALCNDCNKESNKQRKQVLDNSQIPKKPKSGDICSNCNREWSGNWHRHHVGESFVSYLCGHCNMSFSDQRNKKKIIYEK